MGVIRALITEGWTLVYDDVLRLEGDIEKASRSKHEVADLLSLEQLIWEHIAVEDQTVVRVVKVLPALCYLLFLPLSSVLLRLLFFRGITVFLGQVEVDLLLTSVLFVFVSAPLHVHLLLLVEDWLEVLVAAVEVQ